ncbi:hypothetical protein F5X98DRAFT_237848 [Xylaria grammica]|nr:hypothetical protein F5X98DRAFT_237848 [Xylaria grammica]
MGTTLLLVRTNRLSRHQGTVSRTVYLLLHFQSKSVNILIVDFFPLTSRRTFSRGELRRRDSESCEDPLWLDFCDTTYFRIPVFLTILSFILAFIKNSPSTNDFPLSPVYPSIIKHCSADHQFSWGGTSLLLHVLRTRKRFPSFVLRRHKLNLLAS